VGVKTRVVGVGVGGDLVEFDGWWRNVERGVVEDKDGGGK